MYSFAIVLIATFAELSDWPTWVNLSAALVQIGFFVATIASYQWHGMRRDTDNQFRHASGAIGAFMIALIIGEIGGFAILFVGYVYAWV